MTCHYSGIRSVAMLSTLIVCHLFALSIANPFHKYPFVFLLDVGNEELERVNTEQIRVSTPGGSIALRYPAIGVGDTISHVRVSGIDFGTDLKANIVDGGPGYKYVVLVFMGNPGKPYDAVLTVQTVPDDNISKDIQGDSAGVEEDDPNDSAEDLSDLENDSNQKYIEGSKSELMQSSSNVYNYAQENNDYSESDGYESKDIHNSYSESFSPEKTEEQDDEENEEDDVSLNVIPKDEEYKNDKSNDDSDDDDNDDNDDDDDNNDDNEDNDNNGPCDDKNDEQSEIFDEEDDPNFNEHVEKSADYDDSEELDQTFNDEEIHGDKYKDFNNNYDDNDESSAIAY